MTGKIYFPFTCPIRTFGKRFFGSMCWFSRFFIWLEGGSVHLLYPNWFFRAFPSGRAIRCKSSLPSGLFPAIPNALRSGYAGREVWWFFPELTGTLRR